MLNDLCVKAWFSVGQHFQMLEFTYTGVDFVGLLIELNGKLFDSSSLNFNVWTRLITSCRQHILYWSIKFFSIYLMNRLQKYWIKCAVIVMWWWLNLYPAPSVKIVPNMDKPQGGDTHIYDSSAVYLDQSPFNLHNLRLIFEVLASPLVIRARQSEQCCIPTKISYQGSI